MALVGQKPGYAPCHPRTPLLAPFITHDVLLRVNNSLRRHLPTCRSLEAVLAAVADSGKIRAAKWATLPPSFKTQTVQFRQESYGAYRPRPAAHGPSCSRYIRARR